MILNKPRDKSQLELAGDIWRILSGIKLTNNLGIYIFAEHLILDIDKSNDTLIVNLPLTRKNSGDKEYLFNVGTIFMYPDKTYIELKLNEKDTMKDFLESITINGEKIFMSEEVIIDVDSFRDKSNHAFDFISPANNNVYFSRDKVDSFETEPRQTQVGTHEFEQEVCLTVRKALVRLLEPKR